jgi:hypothetical protein
MPVVWKKAQSTPVREIITPPRKVAGERLFIQPEEVGPKRELVEQHHRMGFSNHFNFADQYTGNTRTYDEKGNYNCGRCNMANGTKCLLLDIPSINRDAGSCGDWENTCAGDPEMDLHEKDPEAAVYGVAKNGKGFGCHRCPYASAAHQPDSRGRDLYCGKGDFRVFGTSCCSLNGAPVVGGSDDEDES